MTELQFENTNILLIGTITLFLLFLLLQIRFKLSFLSNTFKFLSVFFLLLSLASPFLLKSQNSSSGLVLIDRSNSMHEQQVSTLLNTINHNDMKLLSFAGELGETNKELNEESKKVTNYTKTFSALPKQSIILISDGFETAGNIFKAIKNQEINPGAIYPLVTEESQNFNNKIKITKLHAPILQDAGNSPSISISLDNFTNKQINGSLSILQNTKSIYKKDISTSANTATPITFTAERLKTGLNEFVVSFDSPQEQQELKLFITGKERPKVLMFSSRIDEERYLAKVLKDQSFVLDSQILSPNKVPQISKLSDYAAIIFNNVHIKLLPRDFGRQLDTYIKEGGSFLMIGGNKSFGLGGYKDTIYEDFLPVKLKDPKKIKKRLNVAIELVLDKSGSMKNNSKIDYTKLAAKSVVDALKRDDYIGIIGFDSQPFIALEMDTIGKIKDKALRRVELLFPNGSTSLYPAMDAARDELERAKAGRKHMIILTDGKLPDAALLGKRYVELAQRLKLTGITVSTFIIGTDDSKLLEDIAKAGGGVFHRTLDARTLPRLFLKDVRVNTAEKTQKEFAEYQVRKSKRKLLTTNLSSFPSLYGYVETTIKDQANLELITFIPGEEDPLLAVWDYGQGKSMAFTSDANGRWSNKWIIWTKFYEFWTNVIDHMIKKEKGNVYDYDFNYYFKGQELNLEVHVYSETINSQDITLNLLSDGNKKRIGLEQLSKGRFSARAKNLEEDFIDLEIGIKSGKKELIKIPVPDISNVEKKNNGFNLPFLYQLASMTGGKVNPKIDEINFSENIINNKTSLDFIFLILGVVFILADILYRELKS